MFLDSQDRAFFSLGLNHVDSATLRYPENIHLWREKYAGSQIQWLNQAVGPDLRAWGFNTLGWCQEVVVRGQTICRHSRNFTREEYQAVGLAYCHMLPIVEAHQWELETRYPDVFTKDFADWCDHVAREHCAVLADDPNLIGYFYCDCPQWVHNTPPNRKGPWFDPERLNSRHGRQELSDMAERYYSVIEQAIRRYDPHHLILGDRYEAKAPLPDEILLAATRHVDVLSFQFFAPASEIAPQFQRWHALTGKPLLLADAAVPGRARQEDAEEQGYAAMLQELTRIPCCVGWHYCGAYLKNRVRGHGLRDEQEQIVHPDFIEVLTQANHATTAWIAGYDQM